LLKARRLVKTAQFGRTDGVMQIDDGEGTVNAPFWVSVAIHRLNGCLDLGENTRQRLD